MTIIAVHLLSCFCPSTRLSHSAKEDQLFVGDLGVTEIELYKFSGSRWNCPNFRYTVHSNGQYIYEGRRDVEPLGVKSGRFCDHLLARLAELCADFNILGMDDHYEAFCYDLPIIQFKVSHKIGVKLSETRLGRLVRVDSGRLQFSLIM